MFLASQMTGAVRDGRLPRFQRATCKCPDKKKTKNICSIRHANCLFIVPQLFGPKLSNRMLEIVLVAR